MSHSHARPGRGTRTGIGTWRSETLFVCFFTCLLFPPLTGAPVSYPSAQLSFSSAGVEALCGMIGGVSRRDERDWWTQAGQLLFPVVLV